MLSALARRHSKSPRGPAPAEPTRRFRVSGLVAAGRPPLPSARTPGGLGSPAAPGSGGGAARTVLMAGSRRPGSMRMGVRNVLRQKRRSTAAIAQVAVAARLAITILALGQSIIGVIGPDHRYAAFRRRRRDGIDPRNAGARGGRHPAGPELGQSYRSARRRLANLQWQPGEGKARRRG